MLAGYSRHRPWLLGFTRAAAGKEDWNMKWGGFNREGEKKMKKLFGGKALLVLLTIAAAAMVLSESLKWRPF
jgi:hypothetical protein